MKSVFVEEYNLTICNLICAQPMKTWYLPDNYEIIFVEEIQCFLIEGQDRRACSEENVLFKFYFHGYSCIECVQSNKY